MQQPALQWCKTPRCKRACRLEESLRTGYCEGCRIKAGTPEPQPEKNVPTCFWCAKEPGNNEIHLCGYCFGNIGVLPDDGIPDTTKGHPEFHRILDEMRALHVKKAADYGTAGDPIANCHSFSEWGVTPSKGMMMRVGEKVQRLKAFCTNGNLQNEGIEDSLKDIVGCAILALICHREEAKK